MDIFMKNLDPKSTVAPVKHSSNNKQRWVRQHLLGEGNYGRVFLAVPAEPSPEMPSVMAVKTTSLSKSEELINESELLKKFKNCPYIIDTYGNDVTNDLEDRAAEMFNVLLEYAQGGTLHDWIPNRENDVGGLREPKVRRYTESILKGLSYMHGEGYVHCDIKPDNVLLVRQGMNDDDDESAFDNSYVAKIGDLGLAKKEDSDAVNGLELYFSPEIFVAYNQEAPADIWALGCTVLQALTGEYGWDVIGRESCVGINGIRIPVPLIPEKVSEDGKDFLEKCFVLDPMERWTAEMLLNYPFVCNKTLPHLTFSRS